VLKIGSAEFFIEYFVLNLIMVDGECRRVVAWSLMDGTLQRFRAQTVILATGGCGRIYFLLHICAYLHRRRGPVGPSCRPATASMEFMQFHPTGIYGAGNLITEGAHREGGFLVNSMERYEGRGGRLSSGHEMSPK
jgi:succinate dehydrogenase / fumarate reductase flavoprotein subunit